MEFITRKEVDNSETIEKIIDNKHTMSYTSRMAAVDIEFNDLTYAVPSPRRGKNNRIYLQINKLK